MGKQILGLCHLLGERYDLGGALTWMWIESACAFLHELQESHANSQLWFCSHSGLLVLVL